MRIVYCLALLAGSALAGCSAVDGLARRVAEPESAPMPWTRLIETTPGFAEVLRTGTTPADGPERPELAWRIVDPGEFEVDTRFERRVDPAGHTTHMAVELDFRAPPKSDAARRPRATVLLLHGWAMDKDSTLPWAFAFADAGWRAVLLDLRNHGASGRAPAGFGPREAVDVARAIDDLRQRGELVGPLVLLGMSYGAAVALETAARHEAVAAVVALEPFANAGAAVRDMLDDGLAGRGGPVGLRLARWRYGDVDRDAVVAAASARLGLDLDSVGPGDALAAWPRCTLLLHGAADRMLPPAHSRALAMAAPRARLAVVDGEDHLSLPLRLDRLARPVIAWATAAATTSTDASCPAFALPATGDP